MTRTILLVEDDDTLRLLTADALSMIDADVIACVCADEAWAVLEYAKNVNLVLTDIRMPGQLDGLQLAKLVAERWPSLPIVVMSGNRLAGDKLPTHAVFIAKPWTLDALFQKIQPLLSDAINTSQSDLKSP